jgi:hypothetical protein
VNTTIKYSHPARPQYLSGEPLETGGGASMTDIRTGTALSGTRIRGMKEGLPTSSSQPAGDCRHVLSNIEPQQKKIGSY